VDVVVCGAQVPFARGGAEMNLENLVAALEAAGHRADLVRLPVAWEKERLFDAPLAWRLIPLDADLVIAMNFPSYYVRHPRKVVWLNHQHRAAYELAGASWSDIGYDDTSLEVQRQLTEWDTRALSEARHVFTVSSVVADRLARFNGITATPLYHPPPLADRLRPGPFGDYVFCPSRLAENKRPDLLIEGLAHSGGDTRLVLAGEGPLRPALEARATELGVRDRLELTGYIDDERLLELYSGAAAVAYPPLDEDYGYVTLQAFGAGKPVITCSDSGGVLEWVDDGINGVVTDGSPEALGAAMDRLASDHEFAAKLGRAGHERVASLDWASVVETLTSA
jgi:glycosyltransferase involved in cell wall biosynthesis